MARCDWYESDDRLSAHYGHILQVWGDGSSLCSTCEGVKCDKCRQYDVEDEGELCNECLSEEAEYWSDYYREEGGSQ